jgi:hypothetical protein
MAATSSMTREEVLRLGQAGRPWEFLPVAAAALEQAPEDQGLRFLASANLARLGLRTLAGEQLDALPAAAQGHPDIANLRRALGQLPEDRITHASLRANCERNAAVLAERGVDLRAHLCAWAAERAHAAAFRALDGNVVCRAGALRDLPGCFPLSDQAGPATHFVKTAGPLTKPACIILEGLNPPWMFRELYEATPTQPLGFRTPILVVQTDPLELLDGLALADLSAPLADSRVRLFVGPDASDQLRAWLRARADFQIASLFVPLATTRKPAVPSIQAVVQETLEFQETEFTRVKARVDAVYAGRDEQWWARRYRAAAAGGPPLKVLIPTCLYSTFIKHSAADLCATLNRLGHIAEVYQEPDDTSKLSGLGYQRALERLEPDLVVTINFPRASMGGAVPANVPYVCWIQDSMPHLFDRAVGAAQGPMDFLLGHTFLELFQKYGYPTGRALPISVVADEAKFFSARAQRRPTAQDSSKEIAFVSHHSETPEAMHARLCAAAAANPAMVRVFEAMYADVRAAAAGAGEHSATLRVEASARERLREGLGAEPDQRTLTLAIRQYGLPLADRMLRHLTLEWAASAARRRGWKLAIYGRGWDQHPSLAEFARPELEHGEALRSCYESAAAHLHVAASTLSHQRVIECYLSGGLCLCRLHRELLASAKLNAQIALLGREPDVIETDRLGYVIADHPEAMALASQLAKAGFSYAQEVLWISRARVQSYQRFGGVLGADQDPTFLLRDLSETTFRSEAELEQLLEKAVERPSWRAAVSGMVAARAREFLTHQAMVQRMLGMVRESLGSQAKREAA